MNAQYETQLKYRQLDENGDMTFGAGEANVLDGLDAMRQALKTRLGAVRGEWWEGDDGALPYFTEILGKRTTAANRQIIDLLIVERIMDTRGVVSVQNVESGFDGRRYHFRCTVNTVYGQLNQEVNY